MTQGIFNNMCFSMFCIKAFSIKGDELNGRKSTGMKRTHMCAEVTAEDIGREIVVMGWVQKEGILAS